MSTIIGIDLGTTNSSAGYLAEGGPCLIPNALGEVLTPSVVGIDPDGRLLVGRAAKELQVTQPERCASLFKRHMGSDWTTVLNGRTYTPEELSGLVGAMFRDTARSPAAGVAVIAAGVILLLFSLQVFTLRQIMPYWPLLVIALGVYWLYTAIRPRDEMHEPAPTVDGLRE